MFFFFRLACLFQIVSSCLRLLLVVHVVKLFWCVLGLFHAVLGCRLLFRLFRLLYVVLCCSV